MNVGQATCMDVTSVRSASGKLRGVHLIAIGERWIYQFINYLIRHGSWNHSHSRPQFGNASVQNQCAREEERTTTVSHLMSIIWVTVFSEYGACSSLSFSPNGTKLVVAFARGHVQLVDCRHGRVLRTLRPAQAHSSAHGLLHAAYVDGGGQNVVVLVDTGGNVFALKFTAALSGQVQAKSQCVFRWVL